MKYPLHARIQTFFPGGGGGGGGGGGRDPGPSASSDVLFWSSTYFTVLQSLWFIYGLIQRKLKFSKVSERSNISQVGSNFFQGGLHATLYRNP